MKPFASANSLQNKCLRLWMEQPGQTRYDLNGYCKVLAEEYPFAKTLNSMARQASAERAWCAISRFYQNCRQNKPGKKGYPKFKKFCRSVEYKTCGWKLLGPKRIKFTNHNGIGELRLVGTYDLARYQPSQIKRVRLVRRADCYYCQFCIKADGTVESQPTGRAIGLDLGIKYFLADSNGHTEASPQFYRRSEHQLNRVNRQKSKKYRQGVKPQSRNYRKARRRYARKHLRVSRQRKEYVKGLAYCVIQSNDLVAYVRCKRSRRVNLNVKGLVKNRHLSKSISDAGWSQFRCWLEYFGGKYGKVTVAVAPHNTSQNCSRCGKKVQKSLSTRTHLCPHCGYEADRDVNAALNILQRGLSTVGQTGIYAWGEGTSTGVGAILPQQVAS